MNPRTRAAILLVLAACSPSAEPVAGDEAGAPAEAKPDPTPAAVSKPGGDAHELADHMAKHFGHAATMQRAVIDGDLEGVRVSAKWMTEHHDPQAKPGRWSDHIGAMRDAAQAALDASDIAGAALAAATMDQTCGACHLALKTGPKFGTTASPTPNADTVSHMLRHQWAADRLHEGLVGPSDAAWKRGAAALAEVPLEACDVDVSDILPDDVIALRKVVHELGASAAKAQRPAERVEVYAKLLTTCAGCHTGGC